MDSRFVITPDRFAAKGDGTTDDTGPMLLAMAVVAANPLRRLYLPAGRTYRIGSAGDITLPADRIIEGRGRIKFDAASSLVLGARSLVSGVALETTQNRAIISVVSADDVRVEGVRFFGSGQGGYEEASGKPLQDGVYINNSQGVQVTECRAQDFGNSFLRTENTILTPGGNHVSGCVAYQCNNMFHADSTGEYLSVFGCDARACHRGARVRCGNFMWVGGQILRGRNGLQFEDGGNDTHPVISNLQINHCGARALWVRAALNGGGPIANGMTLKGCTFFGGAIDLSGSFTGLRFQGCQLDATQWICSGVTTGSSVLFLDTIYSTASTISSTATVANLSVTHINGRNLNGTTNAGLAIAV